MTSVIALNPQRYIGARIIDTKSGIIEELPSFQQLYPGQPVPESGLSNLFGEFCVMDFCRGAMLVNTDTWPKIILSRGMTYVCYSHKAFEDASTMPYPEIENHVIFVDVSVGEICDPQPSTIYICS